MTTIKAIIKDMLPPFNRPDALQLIARRDWQPAQVGRLAESVRGGLDPAMMFLAILRRGEPGDYLVATGPNDTPKQIGEYHCKCGGMAAAYSDDSIQCPGCNRRWQDFAEFMTRSFPLPDTESTRNRLRSRHSEAEISQILGERQ